MLSGSVFHRDWESLTSNLCLDSGNTKYSLAWWCVVERIAAENEALRRDIAALTGRLKQAQHLQEMASMLQESHKWVSPPPPMHSAPTLLRYMTSCYQERCVHYYTRLSHSTSGCGSTHGLSCLTHFTIQYNILYYPSGWSSCEVLVFIKINVHDKLQ